MQLFYAPHIATTPFLPEEESLHCIKVLRHKEGDTINIIDGKGTLYNALITSPHIKRTQVQIVNSTPDFGTHPYHLHLAVAPTKNIDRFEWFVEKATEIGFDSLTPLECAFSERRIIKPERIEKIIISAAKQSLKAQIPILNPLTPFSDFAKNIPQTNKFIAHCYSGQKPHLMRVCPQNTDIVIAIGPEGDFSIDEVNLATSQGFQPITLGSSRLRTETAAVVACHIAAIANIAD